MHPKYFSYTLIISTLLYLSFGAFGQNHQHVNDHMHKQPLSKLIENFENPERDAWQKPKDVIKILGNLQNKTIIDIGCGSGYFATHLAMNGANVICADINDDLLGFAEIKFDSLGLEIEIRKIPVNYCGLIPDEANAALLVNTYHHIDDRVNYFSQINQLLKASGSVYIVDFFKKDLPFGPPTHMKLSFKEVSLELSQAGFDIELVDTTSLPFQYIIKATKKNMNKVKIEIWSDMVCPFCFVGKRKLELAIQKLNVADAIEIIWHSYQLDPNFPKDSAVSATKTLIEKKGISERQLRGMYQNLEENGNKYGIDFQFDKCLTFNTIQAHQLWHWTKQYQKENEWKEAVMIAYFTNGTDLSKKENLLLLVSQIGLNRVEAEKVLTSDLFLDVIQEDIYQSRTLGISGVPYFLINEKYVISGAQDDSVFEKTLLKALEK